MLKNAVKAYNEVILEWKRTRQRALDSGWAITEPIEKLREKDKKPFKARVHR